MQIVISELSLNGWTMFCVWERIIKLSQFINTLGHVNNALQEDLLGETKLVSFWFSAEAIISHVLTFISKQLMFFSELLREISWFKAGQPSQAFTLQRERK